MAGVLRVVSNQQHQVQQAAAAAAAAPPAQMLSRLAGHLNAKWWEAKNAKTAAGGKGAPELRMRMALRQRQGEYEADKMAAIKKQGGSEIYLLLTSVKCRAAASWLRDAITGQGNEKPWTVSHTPRPDLPNDLETELMEQLGQEVGMMLASGVQVPASVLEQRVSAAREVLARKVREMAREKAQTTEVLLEDALMEGGFMAALDTAIDDLVTYPAMIIKGPVPLMMPVLDWQKDEQGNNRAVVVNKIVKTYHRVSPFNIYPMPWATTIDDGDLFELHELTPAALYALIGSPGYNEEAIRKVLTECQGGTLYADWAGIGRTTDREINQPHSQWSAGRPIQALEFWGQVPGDLLAEWGVPPDQVDDPQRLYDVNCWLIGGHVIKASINVDPLGAKPYEKASYEEVPGAFWGNGVPDLIRDVQDMCNAAARSLVNNMAMASGPMVWLNVNRMPPGEKLTELYPWKVFQGTEDAMGSTAPPVHFFQPNSQSAELMNVFRFFSDLADEASGIPKYLAGDGRVGGAGRTSSGLSMLMGNASKLMKQVLGGVDRVFESVLRRTHTFMLRYEPRPELEGDVRIVARGANSVSARETMQLRRNEFLGMTANPIDAQIMGPGGRAALLREQAKTLGMNVDDIVPDPDSMKQMQPPGQGLGMPGQPAVGQVPGQPGMPGGAGGPADMMQQPEGAHMNQMAVA